MNIKSIFTAILMFFMNIFSSIKDLYENIFKDKVDISNSTTIPEIPITDKEYILNSTTVSEIPIIDKENISKPTTILGIPNTDTENIFNSETVPEIPITDKTNSLNTNVLMCTKDKEIQYNKYFPVCDSSFTSLVPALESIGAKSDPSYRTMIANLNGIENYQRTEQQNTVLLDKLKQGTLIESIETKIETITFPCDNEEKSIDSEIIPTSSIGKTKDIKVLVTSLLKVEEGEMGCTAYKDTRDYPTIGYGKKCADVKVKSKEEAKIYCAPLISICTKELTVQWLSEDIDKKMACISDYPNLKKAYEKCSLFRKVILISMCYQMGCEGVSKFKNALKYMDEENWEKAADEMLHSDWHNKKDQSPHRAEKHAEVMRNNTCASYCSLEGWSSYLLQK
jgi:lysozyme